MATSARFHHQVSLSLKALILIHFGNPTAQTTQTQLSSSNLDFGVGHSNSKKRSLSLSVRKKSQETGDIG